ncbi:ABC transporter permease [Kineosporia sp. A_224]|uniref:ABC transporter permease n=1 Tax=Kineosporia sp. A_224 TaxID=1962180 RepID=UPI001E56F2B5|nr:ABC transporter permease [Kineosporia sp. A_224]
MTTTVTTPGGTAGPRAARPAPSAPALLRARRWLGRNALRIYGAVAFAYLFTPIAYITVFSFNDGGRSNLVWRGFTLKNWANPCGAPEVCSAVGNSLKIGITATLIATVLGTMVAFALGRHRFRGRTATNLVLFLPMATPEVVLAASLLTLFLQLAPIGIQLGVTTIVIAHVMFCLSFVVVTVKARIAGLDPRLEQAAADLYATEWQAFRRITLPLVAPGIAGGALLAFSLSFDDFIITNFVSGNVNTFPKFVYVSAQRGIPAQAYVIGAFMFFLALTIVLVADIVRRRRAPK